MKEGIHPKYQDCTIVCVCGNTVHTKACKENIHVEICSKCHPYYTGKQKLVDSAGRVERFQTRYAKKKSESKSEPVQEVEKEKEAPQEKTEDKGTE